MLEKNNIDFGFLIINKKKVTDDNIVVININMEYKKSLIFRNALVIILLREAKLNNIAKIKLTMTVNQ
ncbi:hypothetical protein SAMN05444371_2955 [Epilithonimonas mollis]|uniref:Uncharacterized protein n=1 Tax=Epilithonimonas mollis TaxID=216903 RepID=A0A1M6TUU9_9FLAO|nr:hypothetical protein SAMN05444371_2955 [Epilithonimonas mollis]